MNNSLGRSELLKAVRVLAPPLSYQAHKGQAGRIGVIGGSLEYTGAPYFSAISALKCGADLSHVFCLPAAAQVIKAYSPDLIVHPILSADTEVSCAAISQWLPRLHSLVVGPGLGRDPAIITTVKSVIKVAKSRNMDIVIDADGLHLVQEDPEVIIGYKRGILSPNMMEFNRLYDKMFGDNLPTIDLEVEKTRLLAEKMGGVTVLRKGLIDIISDGSSCVTCEENGCPRRQGGQGDILSGSIGLFLYWARVSEERISELYSGPLSLLSCYTGCLLVKSCAQRAYSKLGRSMLASDMVNELPVVVKELFDD